MNLPIYHDFETLDMKLRLVTYRRQDIYDPQNTGFTYLSTIHRHDWNIQCYIVN